MSIAKNNNNKINGPNPSIEIQRLKATHLNSRIFDLDTVLPLRVHFVSNWFLFRILRFGVCALSCEYAMDQFSYGFCVNYMAHNNMKCHPMCIRIYVLFTFRRVCCRISDFNKNFICKLYAPVWPNQQQRKQKEKFKFFFRFIHFSLNEHNEPKNANTQITCSTLAERWFNKYALTVGLLLIYDKYTQMPIIILCFDAFYCCTNKWSKR